MLDFLTSSFLGQPVGFWLVFLGIVTTLLVFDLGFLNKKDHEMGVKESLRLTGIYVFIACLFGVWVWNAIGSEQGMAFFTAYVVEQSLSMDNLFVMSVIFTYFGVPRQYQHRVLFWGIVGVVLMRGVLIGFGAALVHEFEWVLLLFAGFLIYTGIKMIKSDDDEDSNIENSRLVKFLQKHLRVTPFLHGHSFFVYKHIDSKDGHAWHATPLFLALVTVELADLMFAVDSIPAVLAISTDTFVVYTSNIFAVVGLRSLYFAMAAVLHRFHYMKYALSIILIFIGAKSFYAHFFGKIPPEVSLGITMTLLIGGFIYSFYRSKKDEHEEGKKKETALPVDFPSKTP